MNQETEPQTIRLAHAYFLKAAEDLAAAEFLASADSPLFDVICFHCQQAFEKYLKGFLEWHQVRFRYTHDLEELLSQCLQLDNSFESLSLCGLALNDYSVQIRYPDFPFPATQDQTNRAVECSQTVRRHVRNALNLST